MPVYLYAQAAATAPPAGACPTCARASTRASRRPSATPDRQPDFGPPRLHPTAGATAVGARPPLIAFNINLAHAQPRGRPRPSPSAVRESSGGLVNVQAMGVDLAEQGLVRSP